MTNTKKETQLELYADGMCSGNTMEEQDIFQIVLQRC
eukprot:COSAG02_NODE_5688_length_4126_cov_2.399056_5_plen_37_part_00